MHARNKTESGGRLTSGMAVRLAAPQTWAASTLPAFLGGALAFLETGAFSFPLFLCALAACILMQASVNTLNDYCDFIKGTDTRENSRDPNDAVLVYCGTDPKKVMALGVGFLAAAGVPGVVVVLTAGLKPLWIGLAGALVVLLYSFGRKPIAYLPLGELVSGGVMGELIPLAVFSALTGEYSGAVLLSALPVALGIGLIMFTNNLSDIERDSEAGRKTFPVLAGRRRALRVYRLLLVIWAVLPELLLLYGGGSGAAVYPLLLIPVLFALEKQLTSVPGPDAREPAMAGILQLNIVLGLEYLLALFL
jgi:1,4-dihydroxy-2-naphthoate octaprenyltransferase